MNRITFAAALAFAMLSSAAAIAQSSDEQAACMDDAFNVCGAYIPDRGRVTTCMIQNKSKLSPACRSVMAKYQPGPTAPIQPAVAVSTRPASMPLHQVRTASGRPGKPLNILMR